MRGLCAFFFKVDISYFHKYNAKFLNAICASKMCLLLYLGSNIVRPFFSSNNFVPGRRLVVLLWLEREPRTRSYPQIFAPESSELSAATSAAASPDNAIGYAGSGHMTRRSVPKVTTMARLAQHWLFIVLCFLRTCFCLMSHCNEQAKSVPCRI